MKFCFKLIYNLNKTARKILKMYDTVCLDFVRIRLELGRIHGSGNVKIICKKNRIVLTQDDNGNIEIITRNNPAVNTKIYDFTIGHNHLHSGNRVTDNEYLPDEITVTELTSLANKYIGGTDVFDLVPKDSTEEQLVAAIYHHLA